MKKISECLVVVTWLHTYAKVHWAAYKQLIHFPVYKFQFNKKYKHEKSTNQKKTAMCLFYFCLFLQSHLYFSLLLSMWNDLQVSSFVQKSILEMTGKNVSLTEEISVFRREDSLQKTGKTVLFILGQWPQWTQNNK